MYLFGMFKLHASLNGQFFIFIIDKCCDSFCLLSDALEKQAMKHLIINSLSCHNFLQPGI